MGTYQRDWAEEAEKAVTDSINGIEVDSYSKDIADHISSFIEKETKLTISEAVWSGGEAYHIAGDIHLFLDDGTKHPLELKCSKGSGSGTKANAGATTLTKKIDPSIVPYTKWDIDLGNRDARYSLVENRISRPLKNASDYTSTLRAIRNEADGREFLDQIASITRPGQESYAIHAAEKMEQNLQNVNKWVQDVLKGNNTLAAEEVEDGVIYCVVKKYMTDKQTIEFYDFTEMDSTVTSVVASGQSIKLLNKNQKVVLRLSITWKNICQGGATPCFNVFVGSAYA